LGNTTAILEWYDIGQAGRQYSRNRKGPCPYQPVPKIDLLLRRIGRWNSGRLMPATIRASTPARRGTDSATMALLA